MWLLTGQTQIALDEAVDRWLRPGRNYTVGRSPKEADIVWTEPLSLSRAHFKLVVSTPILDLLPKIDEHNIHDIDFNVPTYTIQFQALKKAATVERNSQSLQIQKDELFELQSGDTLRYSSHGIPRVVTFIWRPLVFNLQTRKKSRYDKLVAPLRELGELSLNNATVLKIIGIRTACRFTAPGITHTILEGKLGGTVVLPLNAVCQSHVVSEEWMTAFLAKTANLDFPRADLPSKPVSDYSEEEARQVHDLRMKQGAGFEDAFWGFSPLELDCKSNWPSEADHFPKYETLQLERLYPEKERWQPDPRRVSLFKHTLLLLCSPDDKLANEARDLATAGQGLFAAISNTTSVKANIQEARRILASHAYDENLQVILVYTESTAESQASQSLDIASIAKQVVLETPINGGSLPLMELYKAVYECSPASTSGRAENSQDFVSSFRTAINPTPTQETAMPSTNPFDATLPAKHAQPRNVLPSPTPAPLPPPRQPEIQIDEEPSPTPAQAPQAQEPVEPPVEPQSLAPPKKKLVRRVGKVQPDLFEELVGGSSQAYPAPNSYMSDDFPTSAQINQISQVEPTPRKSNLKKRVGQEENDDWIFDMSGSGPSAAKKARVEEQGQVVDDDEPMRKPKAAPEKRKAEDDSVTQAKKRIKRFKETEDAKTKLSKLQAEEEQFIAEMRAEDPTGLNKILKQAERAALLKRLGTTTLSTAAKDDLAEEERIRKERYLQINHGKRKVTANEKELTREFNALKIARPTLSKPHKAVHQKDQWQGKASDDQESDDDGNWKVDVGKSFFVKKTLPASAYKQPTVPWQNIDTSAYSGLPNFKRFRPKGVPRAEQPARPKINLVLRRQDEDELDASGAQTKLPFGQKSDSEDDNDAPVMTVRSKAGAKAAPVKVSKPAVREPKTTAKAKPSAKSAAAKVDLKGKGKAKATTIILDSDSSDNDLVDDHMEEDELANDSGSTLKSLRSQGKSQSKSQQKSQQSKSQKSSKRTRNDDIDEESDGLTFKGFSAKPKKK